MLPNSSVVWSRPAARTVYVMSCPDGPGSAPICPDGFTVLCCWIPFARSGTVSPIVARRSGFTQIRIA